MAIIWNAGTGRFEVAGRVGFVKSTARFVDNSTTASQVFSLIPLQGRTNPMAPVERGYRRFTPHQNINTGGVITAGQGTMRAHHVADHQIQHLVCDLMNDDISLPVFLDRMSTLFMTSWIDVILTPRLLRIWGQWACALVDTMKIAYTNFRAGGGGSLATRNRQATMATRLAQYLSSSIANLRIGDDRTDSRLAHAIAPKMRRGMYDLLYLFSNYCNVRLASLPTLSFETSIVKSVWAPHFITHPPNIAGGLVRVGNVFAGRALVGGGNTILLSEQRPVGVNPDADIALPRDYPGTGGYRGYILRGTRATIHLLIVFLIVFYLVKFFGLSSLAIILGMAYY